MLRRRRKISSRSFQSLKRKKQNELFQLQRLVFAVFCIAISLSPVISSRLPVVTAPVATEVILSKKGRVKEVERELILKSEDHEYSAYTRRLLETVSSFLRAVEDVRRGNGDLNSVKSVLKTLKVRKDKLQDEIMNGMYEKLAEMKADLKRSLLETDDFGKQYMAQKQARLELGMAWHDYIDQSVGTKWYLKWQSGAEIIFNTRKTDEFSWFLWFLIRTAIYGFFVFHVLRFVKRKIPRLLGFGTLRRDPNLKKLGRVDFERIMNDNGGIREKEPFFLSKVDYREPFSSSFLDNENTSGTPLLNEAN